MLSDADLALIRRDPALPGLALLLDVGALAATLSRHLGTGLDGAEATYVRYKPGTNCIGGYRLSSGQTSTLAYVKTYPQSAAGRLSTARRCAAGPGAFGPGRIVLDEPPMVASFFPNDRELFALDSLHDPERRSRLLGDLLPGGVQPDSQLSGLRYKPERRFVGRLDSAGRPWAALKHMLPPDFDRAVVSARAFESRGRLLLPALLGQSAAHATVLVAWLDGSSLAGQYGSGTLVEVGEALATLHQQTPRALPYHTPVMVAGRLLKVSAYLQRLCPDRAPWIEQLGAALAAGLSAPRIVCRPCHGDFYDDQLLGVQGRVAVLDLDEAAWDDPASDLGNFLAHQRRDGLIAPAPGNQIGAAQEALLAGYLSAGGRVSEARVRLQTAARLFLLCPSPFRQRQPDWLARTEALLAEVEALLRPAGRRATGPGTAADAAGLEVAAPDSAAPERATHPSATPPRAGPSRAEPARVTLESA